MQYRGRGISDFSDIFEEELECKSETCYIIIYTVSIVSITIFITSLVKYI
jgi:hypothetical protein